MSLKFQMTAIIRLFLQLLRMSQYKI